MILFGALDSHTPTAFMNTPTCMLSYENHIYVNIVQMNLNFLDLKNVTTDTAKSHQDRKKNPSDKLHL